MWIKKPILEIFQVELGRYGTYIEVNRYRGREDAAVYMRVHLGHEGMEIQALNIPEVRI